MSADPTCPSCGVAYTDHLGLNGTCAALQEARADLRAIWTSCTGIVSTAAGGPDADNIPRRVAELRASLDACREANDEGTRLLTEARAEVERLRALALEIVTEPVTKPGWYLGPAFNRPVEVALRDGTPTLLHPDGSRWMRLNINRHIRLTHRIPIGASHG